MAVSEKLFDILVYLRTSGDDLMVKGRMIFEVDLTGEVRTLLLRDFVSYPDSRAYKIIFQYEESITEISYNATIYLTPSNVYNHSFWVKKEDVILTEAFSPITENKSYRESNVVIVSENSVPFFFPVETSYRIGGNVTDLSLMVEQISDSQTGQWPVIVLTDRGIFALEQGSGKVLYSNLIPISNDICSPGAVQTSNGVAYISNKAVNIMIGRQGKNISQILEGRLDSIQENENFLLASSNEELYEVSNLLSTIDFRDYLSGAKLLYDSVKNELIVSNINHDFSYVFNINSGLWHKISASFSSGKGKYALQTNGANVDLVDLSEEYQYETPLEGQDPRVICVHMHSRPQIFNSQGFKTVYRAILRGEIYPFLPFGAYIFGSNDLLDWQMICAAQTEENSANLRLFRSKLSFRYFIISFGGMVDIRTNLAYMDTEIDDKMQNKLR